MDYAACIKAVAAAERLLVVSDFDGTLADFSPDPYDVPIHQPSITALKRLADMPNTDVAVLSGRHLAGLKKVSGLTAPIILAGSHGAESSWEPPALTAEQQRALDEVTDIFEHLAHRLPGAFVEYKPFHRVLHLIRAQHDPLTPTIMEQALAVTVAGTTITPGKFIVEASVTDITKGSWITMAQTRLNPTSVVFIGDDTTDEDGFAVLGAHDLSVKVGPGDTTARIRVADIAAAGVLLTELADLRQRPLN